MKTFLLHPVLLSVRKILEKNWCCFRFKLINGTVDTSKRIRLCRKGRFPVG